MMTIAELVSNARCFACIPNTGVGLTIGSFDAVALYEAVAAVRGGADPALQGRLLESEGGFILLDDGSKILSQQ